jgi:SAM-dependent methyltransferase
MTLSTEEAILRLRSDPRWASLMRDAYLDADVLGAARRFESSGEFAATRAMLGGRLAGATVLDLGAGTGIASRAFVRSGAARVLALEPDPSSVVGQGALVRVCGGLSGVHAVGGYGEALPLRDGAVDVVYARQVLHHAHDLPGLLGECARVMRPGGLLLATREHVADGPDQHAEFLRNHPVHQLAGGENAFSLPEYLAAMSGAGLRVQRVLGPWDSVINAFPAVNSDEEIPAFARRTYAAQRGLRGWLALLVPGATRRALESLEQPVPGRLYGFLCERGDS